MRESRKPGGLAGTEAGDEGETTAVPKRRRPRPRQLDAGPFAADVASFRLHLAAENKAAGTISIYTEAPLWFAAAHLLGETDKTRWDQVDAQDVRRWVAWLVGSYSPAYARQQYRSLRQFFRWLAAEDELPDPMARLRAPVVRDKPVPFFTSVELSTLERACQGNRERPLVTKFGQVTVSRIAYRSPGRPNVHPADAALNLPEEKHSHGLRKMAAIESARGSMEAAGAAITRATGVGVGKRQLEEMIRRAAAHIDAFYLWRVIVPAPEDHALVLTFDGKGIVMLPGALRPATAKAAAAAQNKLATRLSPGEKNGRKRMAELACVYDAVPVPRAPEDIISTPAQKRRNKKAQAAKPIGKAKPREPQAQGKWLTASVTDDIPAVISTAFGEAERRDPGCKRELGRPGRRQQHPDRGRHRGGRGPRRHRHDQHRLHPRARIPLEGRLVLLRQGRARRRGMGRRAGPQDPAREARQVAAGIRRRATTYSYSPAERAGADECARYLENKQDYLDYATALSKGLPPVGPPLAALPGRVQAHDRQVQAVEQAHGHRP